MTNTEIATTSTTITRINPGTWQGYFRYDQAQLRPAPGMLLTLAGQGAISRDGELLHPNDMAAQMGVAMDNVIDLLARGGMDLSDVLHLTIHVTDMDAALASYGEITARLDAGGATPPATLLGTAALAVPGMVVEIDVRAGR